MTAREVNAFGFEYCDAGRLSFFGGRWNIPCFNVGVHVIQGTGPTMLRPPLLCDRHFEQVLDAGLVSDPAPELEAYWKTKGYKP